MITKIACGCVALLALLPARVSSQDMTDMTWHMRNNTSYHVGISFYSQVRSGEWPGNGKAYELSGYERHGYTLRCVRGEDICYGAWVVGHNTTYWGSGVDDDQYCSNCCSKCGDGDQEVTLDK
jgi:hypothetical protein